MKSWDFSLFPVNPLRSLLIPRVGVEIRKEAAYNILAIGKQMPKKPRLIEPIPATMEEIVQSFFANHPKPRDPSKEKPSKRGVTYTRNGINSSPKSRKS